MKNFGEFFDNQVENAGTIILSRSQIQKEEKLQQCIELLRGLNPKAHIITTPWEDLDGEKILAAMENANNLELEMMKEQSEKAHEHHHHEDGECCCGHDHGHEGHEHHHHEDGKCCCGHDHSHEGHHHADDVFTSWGTETANKYDKSELENILSALADTRDYGQILRAKGMIPQENGEWMYFDLVPGEFEIRQGQPDFTGRICVIGAELDKAKLKELFNVK